MRRIRKWLPIALTCMAVAVGLLLTTIFGFQLMVNKDLVKSHVIEKAGNATGGVLDYEHLEISFFPTPHLKVRNLRLQRHDNFELYADELSIYPRIEKLLKKKVSLRSLSLISPEIKIFLKSKPESPMDLCNAIESERTAVQLQSAFKKVIDALAAIDPDSEFTIQSGAVFFFQDHIEQASISDLDVLIQRGRDDLTLTVGCRSAYTEQVKLETSLDLVAKQAHGGVNLEGLNVGPLFARFSMPHKIETGDTAGQAHLTFDLDDQGRIKALFDIRFPEISVRREHRLLQLTAVGLSGTAAYSPRGLVISLDPLVSEKPSIELSASLGITPPTDGHCSKITLDAGAGPLDLAQILSAANAIAGDFPFVQTAVGLVKEGSLRNSALSAGFEWVDHQYQLTDVQASGHLDGGRFSIVGSGVDLENLQTDVKVDTNQVAFTNATGRYRGSSFAKLETTIDWQDQPKISIVTPSARVDLARLYQWLSSYDNLSKIKETVASVSGTGNVSSLSIHGPLLEPSDWSYRFAATPDNVSVTSPLLPFAVFFNGGEISWVPGKELATGVTIEFLDGSFLISYQARGELDAESTFWRIDGTMGKKLLDWIGTISPLPEHLQIKAPVTLSNVIVVTDKIPTVSFTGNIKTAAGVSLFADFTYSPSAWEIRKFQFSDGRSEATISMKKVDWIFDLSFSGNIEKFTADRLFRNNNTILNYLKGDFHALLDPRTPLASSFTGRLEGKEMKLHQVPGSPVTLHNFAIEGHGNRLTILPSLVSFLDQEFSVQGGVSGRPRYMNVDLDVATGVLEEAFFSALQNIGKPGAKPGAEKRLVDEILLEADVRLNATEVRYGGYTWMPLEADIDITGDEVLATIQKASLCGISTTGEIGWSPRGLRFTIHPVANDVPLQASSDCLGYVILDVEANYDLSGQISLPYPDKTHQRFFTGNIDFFSKNGTVYHGNVMMKLLALLNLTELLDNKKADARKGGIGYSDALFKAEIGEGKIHLTEFLFDGDSLKLTGKGTIDARSKELNIILLAAPLTTIDRIVEKIPLVGYITGGSLVSVPFRIRGTIEDPNVVPIPPAAVGKSLVGLMERTLKAPFVLVEQAADFVTDGD